jgi:hypothetical protein
MDELRRNGGWELLNRLHNEKVNAYYLARHGDGIPITFTSPARSASRT